MPIERDSQIRFHELGTLQAVTRWVSDHDEGFAEWLKNARRAYQIDRANVPEDMRVAAILLSDASRQRPGRMGVLDVGGATAQDLTRWSVWQDPSASSAGSDVNEEATQGNGGKAFMYKMFRGPAALIGVRDGLRNAKGFDGPENSVERGIPGFVPTRAEAENAPAGPWKAELVALLVPYGLTFDTLPVPLKRALEARRSFTLVEGVDPRNLYQGRIDAGALIQRIARHDQTTLALEQMKIFAIHNGEILFEGQPIALEEIVPHEGFERPRIVAIPEELPDSAGRNVSTTQEGTRPQGRVVLRTSKDNMPNAFRRLKPRWKVTYRTQHQMIGSKPVSELVPATPGSQFVYATVELAALEPDYVTHGRVRPNDGPLMEAIDEFVSEQIRILAREINDRRRQDLDDQELDEVARENRMLDRWKDQFLPSGAVAEGSEAGGNGGRPRRGTGDTVRGLVPHVIEISESTAPYVVGVGVQLNLQQLLSPIVRDEVGRAVLGVRLLYKTDEPGLLQVDPTTGIARAVRKGRCQIWVQATPSGLCSAFVSLVLWTVDHVLLTPRHLELPVGSRKRILPEVTNDEGERSAEVLLNWRHSADDQLMVRIRPNGTVTANRVGRTEIVAGAGEVDSGVWARIPAIVEVVQSTERNGTGQGKPQLKLTGRDTDPESGEVREGDPEEPVLWQLPSDVTHNIWWLNLDSPEARFAFARRTAEPTLWRMLHASTLVQMVTQVHMQTEYIARGEQERPEFWASHKQAIERFQVQTATSMWDHLGEYVLSGEELENGSE